MNKIDRIGEENINKLGQKMKIIYYKNANNLDVEFENGEVLKHKKYRDFESGTLIPNSAPTLYGFGKNENAVSRGKDGKITKVYYTWSNMIQRCNYRNENTTYKECKVCDEWKDFETFKKWYEESIWDENFTTLDKDILIKGNKLYSPSTCSFVNSEINGLFVKNDKSRGELPIGVYFDKSTGNYRPSITIKGKIKRFKRCDSAEEAFLIYKKAKESHIKQIADEYRSKYPNFPKKLYDAMYNYEVDIND